ncbi:PDR/VanB family oxidoreductase [Paraburkholderia gardini]|uniref:Oxidoreductase NdmD n=1 Tax=Paraburkholderia gardini TaxID=2823469 RepID=A0ABM8U6Q0_9BURK|nr:PDR/VanB family oxidoreductase [Paraburkholderia gardini]CAG4909559.1 Oxidoreductase NdmD [Paraburkholderia gardini]
MSGNLFNVRVEAVTDEAPGIRSFVISRIDGGAFDAYEPGAHLDVTSPSGITRQYSLCGDPDHRDHHVFAVKLEPASRGGSRSLHEDVKVGGQLLVSEPRNLFRLHDTAREHVLVAAGIGITPLLSMAYKLTKESAPFALHYFVRSEEHAAFRSLLSQKPFVDRATLHVGVEPESLDAALLGIVERIAPHAHVYTCGPGAFMDRVVDIARRRVPEDAIHIERFSASPVASGVVAPVAAAFEVQVASSGKTVRVEPGTSIVDALATIGVHVETACREGLCGTCMVNVVSGEADHRDECMSKAEREAGKICCCVSRARSSVLVLDL